MKEIGGSLFRFQFPSEVQVRRDLREGKRMMGSTEIVLDWSSVARVLRHGRSEEVVRVSRLLIMEKKKLFQRKSTGDQILLVLSKSRASLYLVCAR